MNRLQKFVYLSSASEFPSLAHLFFYITAVFGVAFTFFGDTATVEASPLHSATEAAFADVTLPIWGVCAMLITVANTIGVWKLWGGWLSTVSMLGFSLWLCAAFVYLQDGLWFQLAVGAVPNMLFWAWYYLNIKYLVRINKRP